MSTLTLQNFILLATFIFIGISATIFANASLCEFIYYVPKGNVLCAKTEDTLNELNHSYIVLKYKCNDTKSVYENCPGDLYTFLHFQLNDCALTPDTLAFCRYHRINRFHNAPGYQKMVVLKNGTFENHHGFRDIKLSGSGIQTVESRAFTCARNLLVLDLSDNYIEELPSDVFSCLTALDKLYLSNNSIKILSECLTRLRSLQFLDVSQNLITSFPKTALHEEARILSLNLSSNKIQTFCPDDLVQLKELETLDLRGNSGKAFVEGCFLQQIFLQYLDIGGNTDLFVANASFVKLKGLKKLFIDGCKLKITAKESGVFSNILDLSELHLQRNQLQEIYFYLFRQSKYLRYLDLSFNAIWKLQERSFENNKILRHLDLSNNFLSEMKSGDFRGLFSLKHLDISQNHIGNVVQDVFNDLKSLEVLKIGNNVMSTMTTSSRPMHALQTVFTKLENLKTLDMSNSTRCEFELEFTEKNRNIEHLDISFNIGIHLVESSLKKLTRLRAFFLKGVNVKFESGESFSDLFRENIELVEINLSRNNISEINFFNSEEPCNLKIIDLSRNSINIIPKFAFQSCKNLHFLNISHNNLQPTFGHLKFVGTKHLNVLDVSFNNLSWIEWDDIRFVDNVWVSNNNIKDFPISVVVRTAIQSLHLEDNKIRQIDISIILRKEGMSSVRGMRFYMEGNPFDCSCNAFRLYDYVTHNSAERKFSFEGVTCRQPAELAGRSMETLSRADIACQVTKSCPKRCRCLKRGYDGANVVNCSRKDLDGLPEVVPANTTVLDISNNHIISLESLNSSIWKNLTEIRAEGNSLLSEKFYVPKNVRVFFLHENKLTELPESLRKHTDSTHRGLLITLHDNPWSCGCESLPLKYFLSRSTVNALDASEVRCTSPSGNLTLIETEDQELCPLVLKEPVTNSVGVIASLAVLVVALSAWLCYIKNERFMHIVLYTHCGRLYGILRCQRLVREEKTFDCFISYDSEDVEVPLAIVKALGEDPDPEFKFCVHDRNWRGGSSISDNIFRSVEESRKTLIVISKTFIKNRWFFLEFQAALMQMLKDHRDRMIFVVKGDLPDYEHMPRDVRHFLRTRTYLVWGERWFFEKLRYSLQEESVPLREQLLDFLLKIGNCLRNRRIYHPDLQEEGCV